MILANVSQLVKHFAIPFSRSILTTMAVKYKRIFHSFIITTLYHHHDNPPFVDNEEPNVVCNPIFICFHSVGSMFTLLYFSKHRLHSHHITFSPNHDHIKNNVFLSFDLLLFLIWVFALILVLEICKSEIVHIVLVH